MENVLYVSIYYSVYLNRLKLKKTGHSLNHGFLKLQARMVGSKAMMKKEFSDWLTQAAVKVTIVIMK